MCFVSKIYDKIGRRWFIGWHLENAFVTGISIFLAIDTNVQNVLIPINTVSNVLIVV